jgi:hypothetical protein
VSELPSNFYEYLDALKYRAALKQIADDLTTQDLETMLERGCVELDCSLNDGQRLVVSMKVVKKAKQ